MSEWKWSRYQNKRDGTWFSPRNGASVSVKKQAEDDYTVHKNSYAGGTPVSHHATLDEAKDAAETLGEKGHRFFR